MSLVFACAQSCFGTGRLIRHRCDESGNGCRRWTVSTRDMNDIHPAVRKLITVCRCNNIKYGTIEKAIEAGATTIAEVAARTTATTGTCGGSCTPRVLEMIEERWADVSLANTADDDPEDAWWKR